MHTRTFHLIYLWIFLAQRATIMKNCFNFLFKVAALCIRADIHHRFLESNGTLKGIKYALIVTLTESIFAFAYFSLLWRKKKSVPG